MRIPLGDALAPFGGRGASFKAWRRLAGAARPGLNLAEPQHVARIGREQKRQSAAFKAIGQDRARPVAPRDVGMAETSLDLIQAGRLRCAGL